MKVSDIAEKLEFTGLYIPEPDAEISDGYTSDLLSDVIANAPDGGVLITVQAHKNTIAVCGLAGLKAVILCNGRVPDDGMLEAAKDDEVAVFTTPNNQFAVSAAVAGLL